MTLTQKQVIIEATTISIEALEKQVESYKSENSLLLQTLGNICQCSWLSQNIFSASKTALKISVDNKLIGAAVIVEDTIHKYCTNKVLELAQHKRHNQSDRISGYRKVVKQTVEWQQGLKTAPNIFVFDGKVKSLLFRIEKEFWRYLRKLNFHLTRAKSWRSTRSIIGMRHKDVETVFEKLWSSSFSQN